MKGAKLGLSGVVALASVHLAALGHHAPTPYHTDRMGEIEGEITRVLWRNPHLRFTVRTEDGNGEEVLWQVESSPVSRLTRWGLSQEEILPLGVTVKVAGLPPRDDTPQMFGKNLLLPDGREVLLDEFGAYWTTNTIGGFSPPDPASDPSLGLFRTWTDSGEGFRTVSDPELTEEAQAIREAIDRLDPAIIASNSSCTPKHMPSILSDPNPVRISQQDDRIIMQMEEYDTRRVIHMGGETPDPLTPTPLGHTVGEWEDENTLIARTTGVALPRRGSAAVGLVLQTEGMEIIERFAMNDDGSRLDYRQTVIDPAIYTAPRVREKAWIYMPGNQVLPSGCVEEEGWDLFNPLG